MALTTTFRILATAALLALAACDGGDGDEGGVSDGAAQGECVEQAECIVDMCSEEMDAYVAACCDPSGYPCTGDELTPGCQEPLFALAECQDSCAGDGSPGAALPDAAGAALACTHWSAAMCDEKTAACEAQP